MSDYFWIFVSIAVFMGMLVPAIAIILKHKHAMKLLEIEALKIHKANMQTDKKDTAK